jgi:hypothetical protein
VVRLTRVLLSFGEKTTKAVLVILTIHDRGYMVRRDEVVIGVVLCFTLLLYLATGLFHIRVDSNDGELEAQWGEWKKRLCCGAGGGAQPQDGAGAGAGAACVQAGL